MRGSAHPGNWGASGVGGRARAPVPTHTNRRESGTWLTARVQSAQDGTMRDFDRRAGSLWRRLFVLMASVLTAAAAFSACGSDTESTGTTDCSALLVRQPCFDCVEGACCDPLAACLKDTAPGGCTDCLAGDTSACTNSLWNALYACGQKSCEQ